MIFFAFSVVTTSACIGEWLYFKWFIKFVEFFPAIRRLHFVPSDSTRHLLLFGTASYVKYCQTELSFFLPLVIFRHDIYFVWLSISSTEDYNLSTTTEYFSFNKDELVTPLAYYNIAATSKCHVPQTASNSYLIGQLSFSTQQHVGHRLTSQSMMPGNSANDIGPYSTVIINTTLRLSELTAGSWLCLSLRLYLARCCAWMLNYLNSGHVTWHRFFFAPEGRGWVKKLAAY
jgi:hypothetical protein